MKSEIIVALIGLGGSAFGSFIGVLVNTKLTNYRLEQLEKKQDKYNNIIARTYKLEGQVAENSHDILEIKGSLNGSMKRGCVVEKV